jgi:type II secretory pathway pseudopilin PulG
MAGLLVGLTIMAVMMSVALPVWTTMSKREKEEELIWRGQQYARAIGLFQRKYANTFPPSVDVLVEQKFLRKKYKDPITGEDFQPIPATGMPPGGIAGMPPGMPIAPGQSGSAQFGSAQGGSAQTGATTGAQPPRQIGPSARMTSVGTNVQAGVGIQGVVSKSNKTSLKIYNGRTKYNEWAFVYMLSAQRIQGGQPGMPGQQLRPGQIQIMTPDGQPSTTFTPMPGSSRRPDVGQPRPPMIPGMGPGQAPPQPFGQPSPFGPPSPFGQPRPMQPPRPPGD